MFLIVILSGVLCFLFALLVIKYTTRDRTRLANKVRRYTVDGFSDQDDDFGGDIIDSFMKEVRRTGKHFKGLPKAQFLDEKLQQASLPLYGSEFVVILLFFAVLLGFITFLLTLKFQIAIGMASVTPFSGIFYLYWRISRRRQAINNQLGDALTMLANALRAGFSFLQSIELLSKEIGQPLESEFQLLMAELNLGTDIETALSHLDERVDSEDLRLVITAVLIQRQVGGNLAHIIDNISEMIMDRIRMKREIKTLTAQGRLAGWVLAALPFCMAGILTLVSPGYLKPLVESSSGMFILGGAFISEILGILFIRKIVNIDV